MFLEENVEMNSYLHDGLTHIIFKESEVVGRKYIDTVNGYYGCFPHDL